MNLDQIVADISTHLGNAPTASFADREAGFGNTSGWTWVRNNAPWGLRIEYSGERYAIRAFQHTSPGRRAELIRYHEPTDVEIRAVCVLAGLLADWGQPA